MFEVHIFLLNEGSSFLTLKFENDVNMYGTQTGLFVMYVANPFENDVNMHGTQTILEFCLVIFRFENDVKYLKQWKLQNSCTANNQKVLSELRMM